MNTFTDENLFTLRTALKDIPEVHCKRSVNFTTSAVIGTPNKPGCVIITIKEKDYDDRIPFFLGYFPNYHPKQVADGLVSFKESYREIFFNWEDVISFIKGLATDKFSIDSYKEFVIKHYKTPILV